jgi:hypothetical protein
MNKNNINETSSRAVFGEVLVVTVSFFFHNGPGMILSCIDGTRFHMHSM